MREIALGFAYGLGVCLGLIAALGVVFIATGTLWKALKWIDGEDDKT